MGGTFTPVQHTFRWYENDSSDPQNPLELENTNYSGVARNEVLRLRVCIQDTGDKAANNKTVIAQFSPDGTNWSSMGAQASTTEAWRWYNGEGVDGNIIDTQKLSCTTESGEISETDDAAGTEDFGALAHHEMDLCFQNYLADYTQVYYFRVYINGTVVPINGNTRVQVTTGDAPEPSGMLQVADNIHIRLMKMMDMI